MAVTSFLFKPFLFEFQKQIQNTLKNNIYIFVCVFWDQQAQTKATNKQIRNLAYNW